LKAGFQILLWSDLLVVLLFSSVVFCSCDSLPHGGSEASFANGLSGLRAAEVLSRSSWKFDVDELSDQSIVSWLEKVASALSGSAVKCSWVSESLPDGEMHSCVAGSAENARVFHFYRNSEPQYWSFLPAQPDLAFRLNKLGYAPTNVLSTLERTSYLSNEARKGLHLWWTGCFENTGPAEIEDIRLRLWLMLRDAEGQHLEVSGKERKYTARSGIPRKLAPGEFFCTALEVKGLPVKYAAGLSSEITAVIDSKWKDGRGFSHVGPAWYKNLEPSEMSGKNVSKTAVLTEANIYSSRPGKILRKIAGEPLLFFADRQEGRWLHGRSVDGLEGWVKVDAALDIFENAEPSGEKQEAASAALVDFLRSLARGDCASASSMYENAEKLECPHRNEINRKRLQSVELISCPIKISEKSDSGDVFAEAYFAAQSEGRAGRLFAGYFHLKQKNDGSGAWMLADDVQTAAVLNEFVRSSLPSEL